MTDGIINDLELTIDEIVRGSQLPLSIIIVGIGDADFSNMDVLDADEKPLYSYRHRKFMAADIVQFVEFEQFKNNPKQLARQVLEEIPGQFLKFMEKKGITPIKKNLSQQHKIREMLMKNKDVVVGP